MVEITGKLISAVPQNDGNGHLTHLVLSIDAQGKIIPVNLCTMDPDAVNRFVGGTVTYVYRRYEGTKMAVQSLAADGKGGIVIPRPLSPVNYS